MRELGIHVHKAFLDTDLHIIPDTSFANQMDNLEEVRNKMNDSDLLYERYEEKELMFYGLVKTRIRNLLYQGWSEEIVVDIPDEVKKR